MPNKANLGAAVSSTCNLHQQAVPASSYPHLYPYPPQTPGKARPARDSGRCNGKTESARDEGEAGIPTDRTPPGAPAPGSQIGHQSGLACGALT